MNIKPLTREHIWPAAFNARAEYGVRYSAKADKVFGGDLVIRDVCADCNNGPLSQLDNYAIKLYDSDIGQFRDSKNSISFSYNYELLSRWLLKISYNASRGTKLDSELLALYAPTIIASGECLPLHIMIFVGRIAPARRPDGKLLWPKWLRACRMEIAGGRFGKWCVTRAVFINSYQFSLVVLREPIADPKIIDPVTNALYGVPLSKTGQVIIPRPSRDTMQAINGIDKWPRNSAHRFSYQSTPTP